MQALKTLLICLTFLAGSLCLAQTFGGISGEVTDSTGAIVPNATVTATNTGTNTSRATLTNEVGMYSFPSLVPGDYSVRVEAAGFRSAVRGDIELQVQQLARIDFKLEVGQVSEVVEISASAALLNTEDATVGTVIEERRILDLPLNGRNFLQLVSLSPNVTYGFGMPGQASGRQGGDRVNQNISVSGMRGVWNNYTLDGIANTDVNFNLYVLMPSVDALQEFKVQTGIYPAEFGRSATQINVSTKPGTNEYHGTAYWFHRNSAMDAQPYDFDGRKPQNPPFRWNQYGATVGGPAIRNRLFFMGNFEGFKQRQSGILFWSTPTTEQRAGNFSNATYLTRLLDPLTKEPFPNKVIPASRLNSTAKALLEFYPVPNLPQAGFDRNYTQNTRNTIDKNQLNTRIDFQESANSQWFGRFSWTDEDTVSGSVPMSGSTLLTNAKQYMVSNTRVLSPTKVNEARFGLTSIYNELGNELGGIRNVVKELGLPVPTEPPSSWGIPTIEVQRYTTFGNSVNGPFVINDKIFQVVDNFSWVANRHSIRFGGEYRYDIYDQIGNEFPRGRYGHDGRYSGDGAADFMMGNLSRAEVALALAESAFRGNNLAFYVDDVYRVNPKLTLNFGLRWEFFQPYYDKTETSVNSILNLFSDIPNDPNPAAHPIAVRTGDGDFYEGRAFRYITDLRSLGGAAAVPINGVRDSSLLGKRLIRNDLNNFAPRLGISYSPNANWTVRTGAGIFYSAESGNSRFDMNRAMGGRLDRVASPAGELPNTSWTNFLDPTQLPVRVGSAYLWGVVPEIRTSYSMMYILNVQRSLSRNSSLEIGYSGALHRKLQGLQNRNAPVPGTTNILLRRPAPEYGFQQIVVGGGYGNYNGLSFKFTQRMAGGFTALVGYTWSKALDNTSAIRGTTADITQDNRCLDCEYGHSAYNTPHRLVASPLWEIPFGRGRKWANQNAVLNQIIGGWQLGTILTIQSGRPVNTAAGYDAPGTGSFGDPRLNATGSDPNLSSGQRNTEKWWNVSAFRYTPPGTFGNIARNRLIGPSQFMWDFSLLKDFALVERHRLQFRFEAFNFANHPVWGSPGASWGRNAAGPDPGFSRIRGTATSMRQLQFGLKYIF